MNANFSPTLRQLRAFLAVYQMRQLSAAAQKLFVTQSAVSMLIRQLEEGLGTRLFDRTTRSLKPTAAAEEMLSTVERVLRDVDSLSADFRELSTLERGRVTAVLGRRVGPSTGTNMAGVELLAAEMAAAGEQGSIVTLICDPGERYMDTLYDDRWFVATQGACG